MRINQNSRFHKFVSKFGMDFTDEVLLEQGKMSFCTYSKCFLEAVFCFSFLLIAAVLSLALIIFLLYVTVILPLSYYYFDNSLFEDNVYNVFPLSVIIWSGTIFMYIVHSIVRFNNYLIKLEHNNSINSFKEKKTKKPNTLVVFVKTWYKSFKDKFCPMMELINDNID